MNRHFLFFLFTALFLSACTPSEIDETLNEVLSLKKINILLTDNPIDLEEVNVDIQRVIIIGRGERDTFELDANATVYNLLDLQNGVTALLASGILADIDYINQIRLVLGENNSVKVRGEENTRPLKVPSGMQSGIKIKACIDLSGDPEFNIVLDFDAERSIHRQGNGRFIMKPVIKILNFDGCGNDDSDDNDVDDDDDDEFSFDDLPDDVISYLDTYFQDFSFEAEETSLCGEDVILIEAMRNEEEVYLFFKPEGGFIQMLMEIDPEDLPMAVTQSLTDNYSNYPAIVKTYQIMRSNPDMLWYQVMLKNDNNEQKVVTFTGSGEEINPCE